MEEKLSLLKTEEHRLKLEKNKEEPKDEGITKRGFEMETRDKQENSLLPETIATFAKTGITRF